MAKRKKTVIRSQVQAGLFGVAASGRTPTIAPTLTQPAAKKALRGVRVKTLPMRIGNRSGRKI